LTSNPIQDGEINLDESAENAMPPAEPSQQYPAQRDPEQDQAFEHPSAPVADRKPRSPRKKKMAPTSVPASVNSEPIIGAVAGAMAAVAPAAEIESIAQSFSSASPDSSVSKAESRTARLSNKFRTLYRAFRPTEKLIFTVALVALIFSAFSLLEAVNDRYSVELPAKGGSYTEGVVGYARFINPILGYTDADKDMISLIYSGLLKPTPEGKLVADLAKSWTVSDDGLTYDFILKDGLTFHDGQPLTTDDVEFTVQKAQDPLVKSPRAENWAGVTMEKVSPAEIKFTLKKPYSPFLENMTLGILPKHIWTNIEDDAFDINTYNREPIGSGPYKIKKAYRNDTGIYEHYDLVPFDNYSLGAPYISRFTVKFYKGEGEALTAYSDGAVDALGGISPDDASKLRSENYSLISAPLPRVFGLFFNQSNNPVLVNKEVRQALSASVNRLSIIDTILQGWGEMAKSAIPRSLSADDQIAPENTVNATGTDSTAAPNASADIQSDSSASGTSASPATGDINDQYIAAGKKILTDKGWKQNADGIFEKQTKSGKTTGTQTLAFTISTSNVPELKQSAEILRDIWTKLGANVKVEIFEPSDLTQKVIRPRKYDSLLFGNVVGRDLDLYPFWHSSQRNDPGLNIALYTNIKADKALETMRTTSDEGKKMDAYKAFETEIQSDIPAVFLYSPDYIYATSKNIHNLEISNITAPSERFMSVNKWYVETDKVWKIFAK
jgi:peptide/nickel transport system substrate-binding protein